MSLRIVIAGESQCESFAKICYVANYLSKNLQQFCYEQIEKPVLEWRTWLYKINVKNKWHHSESPLVWKELLMEGSKPYYIGGASEFLDYCYTYYKFDTFILRENQENLIENNNQYGRINQPTTIPVQNYNDNNAHKDLIICISGASHPLTMFIISGLLALTFDNASICKIYIYDKEQSQPLLEFLEKECSYIETKYHGKVVRCTNKMGIALANCDLLIVMDYYPLSGNISIGDWLHQNAHLMESLAPMINASAPRNLHIVLPNFGPSCYNATLLTKILTNVVKRNIVVVTSDLGLEMLRIVSEFTDISVKQMFCPPVWGFVGVNHLVDIKNTVHKYNVFEPYNRYIKVRNSTLSIGNLVPELRTMEYLLHFNDELWMKLQETKENCNNEELSLNKAISVVNFVKLWLSAPNESDILSLGILCDGSFGLTFDGIFSQPVKFIDGFWQPARNFTSPLDLHISLSYLEEIARSMMSLKKGELPQINVHCPYIRPAKKSKETKLRKAQIKKATFLTE